MENSPQDSDRIEELQKTLYSRNAGRPVHRVAPLHPKQYDVAEGWKNEGEDGVQADNLHSEALPARPPTNIFKRVFIFSLIFFIIAAAIAGFLLLQGSNLVSPSNITISILGPTTIGAGETLSLDVDIANKNPSDLQLVDLSIVYPPGTRYAASSTDQSIDTSNNSGQGGDLTRDLISLGTIASGQTVQKSISAVLFGQQGDQDQITFSIQYRLDGSNAVFQATKTYPITISSSPVSLQINTVKETNSGQDITIDAHITSNLTTLISNLIFQMNYPFGFQFESATPTPSATQNTWIIGDLQPGASRDITIVGKITGEDNDTRVFRFFTGTSDPSNPNTLGTTFIDTEQSILIQKPFLGTTLTLNNDASDPYIIGSGKQMRGEITWTNNLTTPINNAVVDLSFAGTSLDKTSVTTHDGFYDSTNNVIEWNSTNDSDLTSIAPGATGKIDFEFSSKDLTDAASAAVINPQISLNVNVAGNRLSDTNVPENITSSVTRSVQLTANLQLNASIGRNTGAFTDTGPLPPKAETPSTYTATLQATNSLNDVKNAILTAVLPDYVVWPGNISPSGTALTFDPVTREISWNIGTIKAGAGYAGVPAPTVSFQVGITPSVSQVGSMPDLVQNIVLTGGDSFTGTQLSTYPQSLSTQITGDQNTVDDARVSN